MLSDVVIGLALQNTDAVLIQWVPALPVLITLVLNTVPNRGGLHWNRVSVWAQIELARFHVNTNPRSQKLTCKMKTRRLMIVLECA